MKKIELTQGMFALVDDEDFEELNKYNWCAMKHRSTFYAVRGKNIGSKWVTELMHRVVLNAQANKLVDHVNGNGLDNTRKNLRLCTNAENLRNRGKSSRNKSGYKGVSFDSDRNKWRASMMINGKKKSIGRFDTPEDAAKAYDREAMAHHGEFANINKQRSKMLEPTIPLEKMQEFEREYFSGKFQHQRYGQAFCNHFNLTCSDLFYEESPRTAKIKAWLNFVIFPDSLLEE